MQVAEMNPFDSYMLNKVRRLKDREEMARLDEAIAGVQGLKMCL